VWCATITIAVSQPPAGYVAKKGRWFKDPDETVRGAIRATFDAILVNLDVTKKDSHGEAEKRRRTVSKGIKGPPGTTLPVIFRIPPTVPLEDLQKPTLAGPLRASVPPCEMLFLSHRG
jgi:hypothetical protein